MSPHLTDSRLANLGANAILEAFETFQDRFNTITRRAKMRFENRDWVGMRVDAAERLDIQEQMVSQIVTRINDLLEDRVDDKLVWASMKAVYSGLITSRNDWELAETFFNSVARRAFPTKSGVDPQIEFVDTDFELPPTKASQRAYRSYRGISIPELIDAVLHDFQFQAPFQDLERDVKLVEDQIKKRLRSLGALQSIEWTEVVNSAFYRRKAAYIVGRLYSGSHTLPLALALRHYPDGIAVDAVLLDEDDISILFSFSRSYCHVSIERPYELVRFLRFLMPRKRMAELYISLGYSKHGKTELYRDLLHHIAYSDDKFEIARGQRGMVMIAFTMPGYDVIIKIIKDVFDYPKKTDHQAVKDKYSLVFRHDRAGRLIDAQRFGRLQFECRRFSESLLEELQEVASQTVVVEGRQVIIKHAYIERRVIPLNIYVNEADEEAARAAVIDYGDAIKDLAATNIFPGDLLLKNFGVTRHGRVIFYDYDEICLLTQCNFRKMPPPRTFEDEFSSEPWFAVEENDVFPEQFSHFLGLGPDLHQVFVEHHSDLFEAEYWQQIQEQLQSDRAPSIYPYSSDERLLPVDQID